MFCNLHIPERIGRECRPALSPKPMYTLEQLQQKNLKELKEIGWQLNVLPDGDRRCRQNWIDALIGVQPPLLQLLEDSPGVEFEPVQEPIEVQAQEPLLESPAEALECPSCGAVHALYSTKDYLDRPEIRCLHCDYSRFKNYPGAIQLEAQEPPIESKFGRIVYPKSTESPIANQALASFEIGDLVESVHERWGIEKKSLIGTVILIHPSGKVRVNFGTGGVFDYSRPGQDLIKASIQTVQEPIAQTAIETISDVESRPASADFHHSLTPTAESDGDSSSNETASLGSQTGDRVLALAGDSQGSQGRALLDRPNELTATFNDEQPPNRGDGKGRLESEPKMSQSAIAHAAKNSPGVSRKTSTAHQLLELFKSSAHIIEESPAAETEAEVLESAIVPAAKNHLNQEEGITFSSTFLARYSPPQPEIIRFQSDADGQLSLLDFEVERQDEPPDPDDFERLEDFRRAIALWDAEHPEPLEISLDSFCEWAPCPDDWYEPEPSEVMELSPAPESSITCNFSIPTFDAWCDRANRQTDSDEPPNPEDFDSMFAFWAAYDAWVGEDDTDEPPDTGIFAKLPGPKPPKFPPRAIGSDTAKKSLNANRHTTRSPIAAQAHITHIAAGSSSQSGRSPPGGDAMH